MKNLMNPVYGLFLGILIATAGCSADWLKPEPLSFFTPENTFVNESAYQAALTICRKQLNADTHGETYFNYIQYDHGTTDIAVMHYNMNSDDWTPNTTTASSPGSTWTDWGQASNLFISTYERIKNANVVISRIDNIEWKDPAVRNRILAEALWIRAYWYYRLVHSFGDIPWVGEEVQSPKNDYFSTSRWAILGQIQKDLEYAEKHLQATPAAKGHVPQAAATHLLVKVYLANCDFDRAIAAATKIINGPYKLMGEGDPNFRFGAYATSKKHWDKMWDLHRWENKNIATNTETIYATVNRRDQALSAQYTTGGEGNFLMRNYGPAFWTITLIDGSANDRMSPNSGFTYPGTSTYLGAQTDTLGSGDSSVRPNGYFNYTIWSDKAGNTWRNTPDLRRKYGNWIEMHSGPDAVAPQIKVTNSVSAQAKPFLGQPLRWEWTQLFRKGNDTIRQWFPWPYYKTFNLKTSNQSQAMGGPGDMYVFRLAETFLLRAEAYWWKGQTALAAEDINKVRLRANAIPIDASDVTIDYIFDERARELYTEEPRHSEMVRVSYMFAKQNKNGYNEADILGKSWFYDRVMRVNNHFKAPLLVSQRTGQNPKLNPENMLWPIPQYIIDPNVNGKIKQNKGYVGYDASVTVLQEIPAGGGGYTE